MLRDDINKALTEAMKAKNERAVSTLRMTAQVFGHAATDLGPHSFVYHLRG